MIGIPDDLLPDNLRRVASGGAAVVAGTPDFGQNGDDLAGVRTDAGDAIANILHYLADAFAHQAPADLDEAAKVDLAEAFAFAALDQAQLHFRAELRHLD